MSSNQSICVLVNGESITLGSDTTVQALIARLGLDQGPVAVERNAQVVLRAEHVSTHLADGDVIEIVHFVGGG